MAGAQARSTQNRWPLDQADPDHDQGDDRGGGHQGVAGPGPGPDGLAGGLDPGGEQADGEQHGQVGSELDQGRVHDRDVRSEQADGHDDDGDPAGHGPGADPPDDDQQQRQQDVELGLDGDRPEGPVGAARGDGVLDEQAVHERRTSRPAPAAGLGQHIPGHDQAETERGPVRRQDPPGPAARVGGDRPAASPSGPGRGRAKSRTAR